MYVFFFTKCLTFTLDPSTHHPRHQKSSTPCILPQQHLNFNCTCLSSLNSAVTLHIYSGESHHNWTIWVPGSFRGFILQQVFFMCIMGKRISQYLSNRLDTSSIYLVISHLRTNFSRLVIWFTCLCKCMRSISFLQHVWWCGPFWQASATCPFFPHQWALLCLNYSLI
jgi:hypothetical protein